MPRYAGFAASASSSAPGISRRRDRYGDLEAAIAFGVGFIVIALVILAVRAISARSRARRARRRGIDLAAIASVAAASALPALLKGKGGIIAPIVALAAYAIYRENIGKKPDDLE